MISAGEVKLCGVVDGKNSWRGAVGVQRILMIQRNIEGCRYGC